METSVPIPDFSKAKVGDLVWSCRHGWATICSTANCDPYPITATTREGESLRITFTLEGKLLRSDPLPSVFWQSPTYVKQQRPKRMVTKEEKRWIQVFPNGRIGSFLYSDKETAQSHTQQYQGVVQCVEVTIKFEVEEDE